MQKRNLIFITMIALVLTLASVVYAGTKLKVFVNGQEVEMKRTPQIFKGTLFLPLPELADIFGANVKWEKESSRVEINTKELEARKSQVALLEEALIPHDPFGAVKTWAEGVKNHNGALQYAVMTPELKKEVYPKLVETNWSTGGSSPWIKDYQIREQYRVEQEKYGFIVQFAYTDSTDATFTTKQYVTVENFKGNWLIASADLIEVGGEITDVTLDQEQQVKRIFVEAPKDTVSGYDQANVIIDERTKIYQGYTGRELTAEALTKGVMVEVTFTDEPRTMIYPVSAVAKVIRVHAPQPERVLIYENPRYGFSFTLPDSWQGYKVVSEAWEGLTLGEGEGARSVENGPLVLLRHPEWTVEEPRQDIPIMVFTLKQWDLLQEEKFSIGAAPVGPKELARNERYVFALPARYNYAFPVGYEEVEVILSGHPLQPLARQ